MPGRSWAGGTVSIGEVAQTAVELAGLELHSRGKVREMYDLGDRLLMVASDRISAYDVVLPTAIPDKGKVLTGLSAFWFRHTAGVVANHMLSADVPEEVRGRALVVRKLEIFPVECVVRGYLSGSGWKEYKSSQAVCGIELPAGLRESLVAQVTGGVRWEESIRRMLADGFDTFYEIGPGRVLTGLLKRIDRKLPCTSVPAR